jgi:MFS family permease
MVKSWKLASIWSRDTELLRRPIEAIRETCGDLLGPAFLVVIGCLICQVGLGFGYALSPVVPDILAEFSWDRARYSEAHSWQLWVVAFASPFVGGIASRYGTKRILVASTLLLSLVFFGYAHFENLWQMRVLVVAMGLVVVGVGDVTVGQIVVRWVKRGRGLALGLVYTGSNLGGFILVPLVARTAELESWRTALCNLGWLALLILVPVSVLLVREPPSTPGSAEPSVDATGTGGDDDLALPAAIRTRSFWVLATSLFIFFAYFLGMLQHLILFLTDHGISRIDASDFFRNTLGVGIASKILLGLIADRIPTRMALLIDFGLLTASSLLLLAMPGGAIVMAAFAILFGFSTAARDVVYPLVIGECFGTRYLAEIYGSLMFAILPGGVLGPIFAATIYDEMGSYRYAFLVFAGLNLLALAAFTLLRNERIPRSRQLMQ